MAKFDPSAKDEKDASRFAMLALTFQAELEKEDARFIDKFELREDTQNGTMVASVEGDIPYGGHGKGKASKMYRFMNTPISPHKVYVIVPRGKKSATFYNSATKTDTAMLGAWLTVDPSGTKGVKATHALMPFEHPDDSDVQVVPQAKKDSILLALDPLFGDKFKEYREQVVIYRPKPDRGRQAKEWRTIEVAKLRGHLDEASKGLPAWKQYDRTSMEENNNNNNVVRIGTGMSEEVTVLGVTRKEIIDPPLESAREYEIYCAGKHYQTKEWHHTEMLTRKGNTEPNYSAGVKLPQTHKPETKVRAFVAARPPIHAWVHARA